MQTLLRILDKVKQLGKEYHCFHQEIPPTGQAQEDICCIK